MREYKVRSRDLVDIFNDIDSKAIVLSPYFQRKLVWRIGHKIDFIKTILLGFPFPEIFISRGTLDVITKKSTSCIVDGQQRMNAIMEFIKDEFPVDGKFFSDLSTTQKEDFLKYEIAIIDLDLPQDDPKIIEIFKRLNRTFYALSNIEKLSTEFGSAEFMLVGKLLSGELKDEEQPSKNVDPRLSKTDPNISESFVEWANDKDISSYLALILEQPVFSKYEISRQVHLMYTLNLMSTLVSGFYARNEKIPQHLDLYAEDFPAKNDIVDRINRAAQMLSKLKLPISGPWYSKSNSFSLLILIDVNYDRIAIANLKTLKEALLQFSEHLPDDYALAAREAVNNKRERLLRNNYLQAIIEANT